MLKEKKREDIFFFARCCRTSKSRFNDISYFSEYW